MAWRRPTLAQLTWTLTQFPAVCVFSGEGLILDHPLTRADFRSFG